MVVLVAEAFWITCENGLLLPLEIALAASPDEIYIFQIGPLPDYYWQTIRDRSETRSRRRNRDRFYNASPYRLRPLAPVVDIRLDPSLWRYQLMVYLERYFPSLPGLLVRGSSQYHFFRNVCGFQEVRRVSTPTVERVLGCRHRHVFRQFRYPCPGVDARTLAKQVWK